MTRLQNWPSDAIDRISYRASGLFIWARTACKFIMNGFDRLERLELVLAGSRMADIDSLYTTAIKVSILDSAGDNMNYLRQCLGAVVVTATRTPLSASNLALLLHGQISQNVLERVLLCLTSVLYVDEKLNDAIRISHPSFMDFVTDRSRSGDLCIDLTEQNTIVAERCLSIMAESLRFNICELETSDLFNSDVQNLESRVLVTIRPHLSYSCLYWSSHVVDAQVLILGEGLRRFLFGKELIYWIEALSLLGKLSTAPASLLGLMACLTSNVVQDCRAVANDAYRFVLSFYDAILKSTPHLYISALAFAPSSSGIAQRMRRLFPKLLVITQGAEQEWTPCLRSVWVSSDVTCAVFSPDSRRIVSGSADGKVRVWDAETGDAELEPMVGHSDGVSSVAFSPNGRWIVSGSNDKTIPLWNSETGKMHIGPLRYHTDLVFSVAFSPDSRRVASSSRDKTIHVWDLVTSKSILKLAGHSSGVRSVTFSPDGRRIISGSDDRTMRIWNLQTGELKLDPLHGHSSHVRSVAFSPDGNRVVSSSDDRTVRIWDATTGNTLFGSLRGHSNRVQSVTFSPDSCLIASGSADRTVRIWNANTGDAVFQPLDNHSDSVRAVSFSPDGRRVVSGSKDKTMRIWDVVFGRGDSETRQSYAASKGHAGFVKSVAFSPSGRCVASGSDDRTVRVWEAETGIMILGPLEGHTGTIQSIAFSSDSRWILSSSEDKTARIWDAESGNPVLEPLRGHSGVVLSAVFSPDSHLIASGSQDRTIRIWDVETGKETLGPLVGHSDQVTSVAFSPGGHQLVSGSWDKTVRIWDAYTGQALLEPLLGHSHWVLSVAFSPDGCRIVSGSHDTTLRIWDAGTGNVALDPLQGHGWSVRSVTFSPDGRWIASGSDDGTVRVWNTDTGETVLNPLLGHAGGVASIAFSPDGRRVVSGSWDKTIRIWSVESHISENSHISRFQLGTLHSNLPTGASSSDSATTGTNIQAPPVHTPSDMLLVAGAQLARHLSKNLPGWVTSIEGKPIVWLPPELREVDDSLVSITPTRIRRQPLISFANFVHGSSWASILDRQV
ncbi:hypothetical protein FRC12_001594 [Ceratobasidium sp. 428]|nr:hypothetical protein FRC12_001594 [Ceratobasidium sp. 428]